MQAAKAKKAGTRRLKPLRGTGLLAVFFLLLVYGGDVQAQVYFNIGPEEVKAKAKKAGFVFDSQQSEGTPDLHFYKADDATNKLVCFLDTYQICNKFSYTLPAGLVVAFHKNLEKHFAKREEGVWASREKHFLLQVSTNAGITTVVYLPYTE